MNKLLQLSFVLLILLINNSSANSLKKIELNKNNSKEKLNDQNFNLYLKESRNKINNQKNLASLVKDVVKKVHNYANFNNTTVKMRSFRNHVSVSSKTLGNLAMLGIVLYATMSSFAPNLRYEISRNINQEDRQGIQNLITHSLVGVSESLMSWVEKSVDDLPSFPRLDAQECMKRCICEAHNQPKKYGLIGLSLQLFFPPYTESNEPNKIVSKYQLAARYGRQENANCATQYDDCMVNLLDIVQSVINLVF